MVTFKPVIYAHHRRKDGTYNIKIRITHKGVHRHIATSIYCTDKDLTRSLQIKSHEIQRKAEAILSQLRSALMEMSLFDIEANDVDWVVSELRRIIRSRRPFSLDFISFGREAVSGKKATTAEIYLYALDLFARWSGKKAIDINSISADMLQRFHADLMAEGKASADLILKRLAHIFRLAQERYNDGDEGIIRIPRHPFDKLKYKPSAHLHSQKAIPEDVMQRIIDARDTTPGVRMALDAFLLSFCLMGANMADMMEADPPSGKVWRYERAKTRDNRIDRAMMQVEIPDEALPYIARLRGKKKWLLFSENYATKKSVLAAIWLGLHKWCRDNGVEPFSLYAARHSWATYARRAGIDKSIVDECLAHIGDFRMADVYAERDWTAINSANRKVLARFVFHK